MDSLTCTIHSILFQNENTGYSVVKLQIDNQKIPFIAVGEMPSVFKGMQLSVNGKWELHKQYGKQFVISEYSILRPTTLDGITSFLTSGIITNIGPVKAKKIIEMFGLTTLDIIENNPEQLHKVPGIGNKTIAHLKEKWREQNHLHELMLFFKEMSISLATVNRLYKKYGEATRSIVSKNPYILCEEVYGIGFKRADLIALGMGFTKDSYQRIRAGLLYVVKEAQQEGHTFLPREKVCTRTIELLDVSEEKVFFSIDHLCAIKLLIIDNSKIYLPALFYAETGVAQKIAGQMKASSLTIEVDTELWIQSYQKSSIWQYGELQIRALKEIIERPCLLLTGGPGTGKTTILKIIVSFFEHHQKRVVLAAPTGRAAQRMKETTGKTAQTIHRLLEYIPQKTTRTSCFAKNEKNTIDADLIIIDEVSMVDIQLMYSLCCAIKNSTKLLLVGDSNQLPSVGAGNVIADLVVSKCLPHIHLTTIFRQAERSRIISAAHEINNGIVPTFLNDKEDNCFFLEFSSAQEVIDTLITLVTKRLPQTYKINPVHDIQVLSPMHRGELGTDHINEILRTKLHQSEMVIKQGEKIFHLGEKVLQSKNNYENNVFNGDIGYVSKIVDEHTLIVDFNGNSVLYSGVYLDDLIPAYCISIHKSQGSEFNVVIILLTMQHYIMLQRNLVYTALTRGKKLCIFLGSKNALKKAVENKDALVRYSYLEERIKTELCG